MFDKTECAHESCNCKVGEEGDGGIVAEDGRHFCSESCRSGEGCVWNAAARWTRSTATPQCGCKMDTVDGDASPVPML